MSRPLPSKAGPRSGQDRLPQAAPRPKDRALQATVTRDMTWSEAVSFQEAVSRTQEGPVLIRLEEGHRGLTEQLSLSIGDTMALEGCTTLKGSLVVMAHYVESNEDEAWPMNQDVYRALLTLPVANLPDLEVSILDDPDGESYQNWVAGNFGEFSWQNQKRELLVSLATNDSDTHDYENAITVIDITARQRQRQCNSAEKTTPDAIKPRVKPLPPVPTPRREVVAAPMSMGGQAEAGPPPRPPRKPISPARPPASPRDPGVGSPQPVQEQEPVSRPRRPPRQDDDARSPPSFSPTVYNVYRSNFLSADLSQFSFDLPPIAQWNLNPEEDNRTPKPAPPKVKSTGNNDSKEKKNIRKTSDQVPQPPAAQETGEKAEDLYIEIDDEDIEQEGSSDDSNDYACIDEQMMEQRLKGTSGKSPSSSTTKDATDPADRYAQSTETIDKGDKKTTKKEQKKKDMKKKEVNEGIKKAVAIAKVNPMIQVTPQRPPPPLSHYAVMSAPLTAPRLQMCGPSDIYEAPTSRSEDPHAESPLMSMTCGQLCERLDKCGMPGLAAACRTKRIDGRFFLTMPNDKLMKAPFSCDEFDVNTKVVEIKKGWVPKEEREEKQIKPLILNCKI